MSIRRAAASAVALIVALTACSSDTKPAASGSSASSAAPKSGPVYAGEGPFKVGYTTLHLADRDVAVWYPAADDAVAGKAKATYDQTTPLPDNLKALTPPEFNTVITMNAFTDVPASAKGPFPVVLFSHGFGGYRLINSTLDVGIASWGFVVVSVDYLERGLVSQITGGANESSSSTGSSIQQGGERDRKLMLDGLDLVTQEAARSGSLLSGAVDTTRVATVGHSAGGGTAFNTLNDPRVAVAIGWAPVAPSGIPADKPTMIIGAGGDSALTPDALTKEYTSFPAPKRFVEIGGTTAGHNTFTDVCNVIRSGGGLVEFARKNNLVNGRLLDLAENGCHAADLAPDRFMSVVQHFTVAELRSEFGIDPQPVGLDDAITSAFGDIPVEYQHQP